MIIFKKLPAPTQGCEIARVSIDLEVPSHLRLLMTEHVAPCFAFSSVYITPLPLPPLLPSLLDKLDQLLLQITQFA